MSRERSGRCDHAPIARYSPTVAPLEKVLRGDTGIRIRLREDPAKAIYYGLLAFRVGVRPSGGGGGGDLPDYWLDE